MKRKMLSAKANNKSERSMNSIVNGEQTEAAALSANTAVLFELGQRQKQTDVKAEEASPRLTGGVAFRDETQRASKTDAPMWGASVFFVFLTGTFTTEQIASRRQSGFIHSDARVCRSNVPAPEG